MEQHPKPEVSGLAAHSFDQSLPQQSSDPDSRPKHLSIQSQQLDSIKSSCSTFDASEKNIMEQKDKSKSKFQHRRSIFGPGTEYSEDSSLTVKQQIQTKTATSEGAESEEPFIFSGLVPEPCLSLEGINVCPSEISSKAILSTAAGLSIGPSSAVLQLSICLVSGTHPGDAATIYIQPTSTSQPIACIRLLFCKLSAQSAAGGGGPTFPTQTGRTEQMEWPPGFQHRIILEGTKLSQSLYFEDQYTMTRWVDALQRYTINGESEFNKKFAIFAEVAKGTFGVVFEGVQKASEKSCAVKSYSLSLMAQDPVETTCILREISILSGLSHPGCMNLIGVYLTSANLLLVSDYYEGGDLLLKIIKREKIQPKAAIRHIWELLSTISYLESVGIIHRDIKPQNIILRNTNEDSDLCLVDFGFATCFRPGESPADHCGTKSFAAPEILRGQIHDSRADIYSAGVVLHLMLFGSLPSRDLQPRDPLSYPTQNQESVEENNLHSIFNDMPQEDDGIRTRTRSLTLRECSLNLNVHENPDNQTNSQEHGEPITAEDRIMMQKAILMIRWMLAEDYQKRPFAGELLTQDIFLFLDHKETTQHHNVERRYFSPSEGKRPGILLPGESLADLKDTDSSDQKDQTITNMGATKPIEHSSVYSTPSKFTESSGGNSPDSPFGRAGNKGYNPQTLEYLLKYVEQKSPNEIDSPGSMVHSPTFVNTMEKLSRYQKSKLATPAKAAVHVSLFTGDTEERRVTF